MKICYVLGIILLLQSGFTYSGSGCIYNGKFYAEGSTIGPLKCVDGKWIKK